MFKNIKDRAYKAGFNEASLLVDDAYSAGYKAGNHSKDRARSRRSDVAYNKGQIDAFDELLNEFAKNKTISDKLKTYLEKRNK